MINSTMRPKRHLRFGPARAGLDYGLSGGEYGSESGVS